MSHLRTVNGVSWPQPTKATLHPRIPSAIIQPAPRIPPEHTTRPCAEALAARLTAWWHGQGWPEARFWCVVHRVLITDGADAEQATRYQRWDIRSNLHNGIPPATIPIAIGEQVRGQ